MNKETEWSRKKRSSLHLTPELNNRIDDILLKMRREMNINVKKTNLMEKWVEDGVDYMEKELKIKR